MRPIVIPLVLLSVLACQASPDLAPVSRSREIFSSPITITLFDHQQDALFERIFARLEVIDAAMSAHKPDSEVSRVSAASGQHPVTVSADTFQVLASALDMARLTGGIFDPTIGPVSFLWNVTGDHPHVATPEELKTVLPLVDWKAVQMKAEDRSVFLPKAGMRLDFGGIAKGYAADEAARLVREAGLKSALLSMGGSTIFALGQKPVLVQGQTTWVNWKVGVQNPEQPRGEMIGILEVADSVVESSGSYERFFEEGGKRYHHIMDPRTGAPAESGLTQVTLVLPADTKYGDGLSTSCFILGLEKGRALIQALPGAAALFVTADRKVYPVGDLKGRFTLKDSNFTLVD